MCAHAHYGSNALTVARYGRIEYHSCLPLHAIHFPSEFFISPPAAHFPCS